jgi:DTW domain-containing protein YfiP
MSYEKAADDVTTKKKKRPICSRCDRPSVACICEALPLDRLSLHKCELVVLQHPHEKRRKNRSLPLVELCLSPNDLHTIVARRFGDHIEPSVMRLLQEENVLLVYPGSDAISLTEGLQQIEQCRTTKPDAKITVVFLDATWKYAREMHMANESTGQYPSHMIRIALNPEDWQTQFQNRFDIRTPPSPNHLSTAECIAWVISVIEKNPLLYDTLMKPLDLMVEKWHSYNQKRSFTDGDGTIEHVTIKKRKRG